MGVFSAKNGKVSANGGTSALATVRNFNLDYTSIQPDGNASGANQGAPFSVPGPSDFKGDLDFYGQTFLLVPGVSFNFEASNGTEIATGTALVESCNLKCSIQSGGLLEGSVKFGGNGALTLGSGATSMTDANVPEAYPSVVCKASWGPIASSPTVVAIAGVTEWTLDYSCNLNEFVTSDTSSLTNRNAGAINGLNATVSVLNSTPSGLVTANMTPGLYGELRLYVSATTFFGIRWMGVTSLRETAPIERGGNVELQAAMKWSSYRPISGTQTVGYIKNPAAATVWP
jgi:hypothetical protein